MSTTDELDEDFKGAIKDDYASGEYKVSPGVVHSKISTLATQVMIWRGRACHWRARAEALAEALELVTNQNVSLLTMLRDRLRTPD